MDLNNFIPILTFFITIITGLIVLVLGQIFIRFCLIPIQKQYELIGEINDSLIFYADVWSNQGIGEEFEIAKTTFRRQSTQLRARSHLIPRYNIFSKISFIIPYEDMLNASKLLLRLSNSLGRDADIEKNNQTVANIQRLLKIKLFLGGNNF